MPKTTKPKLKGLFKKIRSLYEARHITKHEALLLIDGLQAAWDFDRNASANEAFLTGNL